MTPNQSLNLVLATLLAAKSHENLCSSRILEAFAQLALQRMRFRAQTLTNSSNPNLMLINQVLATCFTLVVVVVVVVVELG